MPQLPDEGFQEATSPSFGYQKFYDFLRQRRSVRVFKDKPVKPELVDKVLKAASTAPMGLPPHSTEILVVDGREELDLLLKELVQDYAFLVRGFSNPIGRALIRLSATAEKYALLKDYIVDMARYANAAHRRDASDYYLRKAPVLLLVHGNRRAMSYLQNAHLVCHHAMLAAVSLGLDSTIIGLAPPIVDRSATLR